MNNNKENIGMANVSEPVNGDRYLSVKTVFELYDIKPDTVRKWIQKRLIPSFNIRGLVRVKLSDVESLVSRKPSKEEAAKKLLKVV